MKTKSVLYAAVGAPVVAARKVSDKVSDQYGTLKTKVGEEKANYTEVAQKAIDGWAVEGEKVVTNVQDKKVVEEISSKVDLDQAKEQVTKLRDQLEDMLATWKTSFRPEKEQTEVKAEEAPKAEAKKPAAKKPAAAKSTPAKGGAAKKPAAAKTTTAKSGAAKSTAAKKPAAEKSDTKASYPNPSSRKGPPQGGSFLMRVHDTRAQLTLCTHKHGQVLIEGSRSAEAVIHPSTMASVGRRLTTRSDPLSPMILASKAVGLRRRRSRSVSTPAATKRSAYSAPTPRTRSRSAW